MPLQKATPGALERVRVPKASDRRAREDRPEADLAAQVAVAAGPGDPVAVVAGLEGQAVAMADPEAGEGKPTATMQFTAPAKGVVEADPAFVLFSLRKGVSGSFPLNHGHQPMIQ